MLNEFREDLVSGEWVLFATGRAKRPDTIKKEKPEVEALSKDKCPFEDPEKYGNVVLATYWNDDKSDWSAKVTKNKFPAVLEGEIAQIKKAGPFNVENGVGRHEIVIFRDHDKQLWQFSKEELARVFKIYQDRYLDMLDHSSRKYTLIFHNNGPQAGASIEHPHSQIISIPVLPPDVKRSINGSAEFYKKNKKRIYDVMIDWEKEEKKRILYENEYFIAFCPFISRTPYEVRIFPQTGHAHFEKMPEEQLTYLGEAMQIVLKNMHAGLNNPDYNFFIHTAPLDTTEIDAHNFYTWHIEIIPKVSMIGAFELGSGIDVNVVDPDESAKILKETHI
jgi:UDPglucose--hexose-1-phosphate uridylyltransferase